MASMYELPLRSLETLEIVCIKDKITFSPFLSILSAFTFLLLSHIVTTINAVLRAATEKHKKMIPCIFLANVYLLNSKDQPQSP